MRLWHYKLIPFLPKSQLLSQWRELNSIYKNQNKHILINYVYDYSKGYLYSYSTLVLEELKLRGHKIDKLDNFTEYFDDYLEMVASKPFIDYFGDYSTKILEERFLEHNDRYLLENFYNLQEKYYAGQKDFSKEIYEKLCEFMKTQKMEIIT